MTHPSTQARSTTLLWSPTDVAPAWSMADMHPLLGRIREPLYVLRRGRQIGIAVNGSLGQSSGTECIGSLPPLFPEWLGDRGFLETHNVRFPYVVGEMANGIATATMVIAAARAGLLGFFGAAGLSPERIETALHTIQAQLGSHSFGSNLIHSPQSPELEERIVDLYLQRNVCRVSASAFMALSPAIVRYAATGLVSDGRGGVRRRNHVFAKVSRLEVAELFMNPPPGEVLSTLVQRGQLTTDEAALAAIVPVADDITVEADSGGHTDGRPLTALFPSMASLRDRCMSRCRRPIRLGAAGGLGTPSAVAAAFALGASYVLTGSVNQASVESGLSQAGKEMLAVAGLADVAMAPSADMFELGVKVQVLKRGTMYAMRAGRLYDCYRTYDSIEAIPEAERQALERDIFAQSLDEVWHKTHQFFTIADPHQIDLAERHPRHRMALIFRWYLGLSSKWAIEGVSERRLDYQMWCGPAMDAFNDWVAGSKLHDLRQRSVQQIAWNLLEGAAVITRAQHLRSCGLALPESAFHFVPRVLN